VWRYRTLLSFLMPNGPGPETVQALRADERTRSIPASDDVLFPVSGQLRLDLAGGPAA